jgi:superfamily II DNA/RNA helicase
MNSFKALGIDETWISKLKNDGVIEPTAVQTMTIGNILEGSDIMAEAQTGTGKTLAFLLPMFQKFDSDSDNIQGLILTPTRELAIQITGVAKQLAEGTSFTVLPIYGGIDTSAQIKKLNKAVTLIVATPGRLLDHLGKGSADLSAIKTLVLDEVDQMLLSGFKFDIERILEKTNTTKQVLCFSATLDSNVKKMAYKIMKDPIEKAVKKESVTLETIEQKVVLVSDRWKEEALFHELEYSNPYLGIIFCRTKRRADQLETHMIQSKYNCVKLHGDMSQNARQRVMRDFREGKYQYLVTTDVAARGLDISGVGHIYNFDVPETPEIYIHRIGRTGRMGEEGVAITFVAPKDEIMLKDIERTIKMELTKITYERTKGE